MITPPTLSAKHPALSKHICALNDGKQSCKCFMAGWKASEKEQTQIMAEDNKGLQDEVSRLQQIVEKDTRIQTAMELRGMIEELEEQQIQIMKEHETIYEQWKKKTEEYETKISDLEIAKEAAIRNLKTIKKQIERGVDEKDILAQIAYAKDEIITPFSTYL